MLICLILTLGVAHLASFTSSDTATALAPKPGSPYRYDLAIDNASAPQETGSPKALPREGAGESRARAPDYDATTVGSAVVVDQAREGGAVSWSLTFAIPPALSGAIPEETLGPTEGAVATETETSQLFRAVEPNELTDLVGSEQYRTVVGLEGKYFFPTAAQAENFAELMSKVGHGPFCITSGCIDSSLLSGVEKILIAGEGLAWFVPEDLPPYINNIVNLGPAG